MRCSRASSPREIPELSTIAIMTLVVDLLALFGLVALFGLLVLERLPMTAAYRDTQIA